MLRQTAYLPWQAFCASLFLLLTSAARASQLGGCCLPFPAASWTLHCPSHVLHPCHLVRPAEPVPILACAFVCVLQAYYMLDEILMAGELQESSKKSIARVIAAQVRVYKRPPPCFRGCMNPSLSVLHMGLHLFWRLHGPLVPWFIIPHLNLGFHALASCEALGASCVLSGARIRWWRRRKSNKGPFPPSLHKRHSDRHPRPDASL